MNLKALLEKVKRQHIEIMKDGRIIVDDEDLKRELELILPLSIIIDGVAAIEGYLGRDLNEEFVCGEIISLEEALQDVHKEYNKSDICFNTKEKTVSCADYLLEVSLTKRVPAYILVKGYDAVIKHLAKKIKKYRELFNSL